MTLYDCLFIESHVEAPQKFSWQSCILHSQDEEERGRLLAGSIKNLEWRCYNYGSTSIPDGKLDIIEVEMVDPQYMYFVPPVLFQAVSNHAIVLFEYQGVYKLCVNDDKARPVFSPWFELESVFGKNEKLLAFLQSVTLEDDVGSVWDGLKKYIVDNEAIYITYPKFRCMVFYLIRQLGCEKYQHGDRKRAERLLKDNCIPYRYFRENRKLKEQRLAEEDEVKRNRQYCVFDLIYDLDQLWDVIMRDGWLTQRLENNGLADIRLWIERQENYFEEYPDSFHELPYGDRGKIRHSKQLSLSGWYMVDFIDRIPKGHKRSGAEIAAILPTYHF